MTISYLPHKSVPWQVSTEPPPDPRKVQSWGTTASTPELHANPEWEADLEYVWQIRQREKVGSLTERARSLRRTAQACSDNDDLAGMVAASKSAQWSEDRARALAMPRRDVVAACRKRWMKIKCGCSEIDIPVGCEQPLLCEWCQKRHWRKLRKKVTRSLSIHEAAARAAWNKDRRGMRPGVYLITLTGPHSGDIQTDRRVLGKAWRSLSKRARAEGWWGACVLVWEVTPGDDGQGHVHAHVAAVSSWVPYEELHAAWREACPGARNVNVQAPDKGRKSAGKAAHYLAKYVTKGVQASGLTGRKAGEMLAAFYGRRKITTSEGFWVHEGDPRCKGCECRYHLTAAPVNLQSVAPAGVLRARAEMSRWHIPRGVCQASLRWDGS